MFRIRAVASAMPRNIKIYAIDLQMLRGLSKPLVLKPLLLVQKKPLVLMLIPSFIYSVAYVQA